MSGWMFFSLVCLLLAVISGNERKAAARDIPDPDYDRDD